MGGSACSKKENQNGSVSPSCRCISWRFTERPSILGGVPVLKRSTVSPTCHNSLCDFHRRILTGPARRHLGIETQMNSAPQGRSPR